MSDITFSDRALARSLGTSDPEALAAARAVLNDPDSEVAVTRTGSDALMWCSPNEEIERIARLYLRPSADNP